MHTHEPTRSQNTILELFIIELLPSLAVERSAFFTVAARAQDKSLDTFGLCQVDKLVEDGCWISNLTAEQVDSLDVLSGLEGVVPGGLVVPIEANGGSDRAGRRATAGGQEDGDVGAFEQRSKTQGGLSCAAGEEDSHGYFGRLS